MVYIQHFRSTCSARKIVDLQIERCFLTCLLLLRQLCCAPNLSRNKCRQEPLWLLMQITTYADHSLHYLVPVALTGQQSAIFIYHYSSYYKAVVLFLLSS